MSMLIRSLTSNLRSLSCHIRSYCSDPVPKISARKYQNEEAFYQKPRQVWIESMNTVDDKKLGIMSLHPEVFATAPRIDIIHQNVHWQRMYRYVSYAHTKTRGERRGGGRKPWPQKGMGRARHGSIRSPLWKKGGIAHGPRSPTPYFFMLPFFTRVAGLTSSLSVKLAQDDLHVIDDLEIPVADPSYIQSLVDQRNWGPSVLFVDTEDIMPKNITLATDEIKHINLMPVYGLNVYSMIKHNTLVLTERAVRLLEDKLLFQLHRPDTRRLTKKFKVNQQ